MIARTILSLAVVSSLGLLSFVAAPREASACSPPTCTPARALVSGSIPANGVVIPYVATESAPAPSQTFRLLNPGNAEVPTTSHADTWWANGQLLVPNGAVAPGTGYHVSYAETCSVGGTAGDVARAFDVGPATSLPSTVGTLHGTGRVVGPRSVLTSIGSCTSSIKVVAIDVQVVPSAELRAYAGVTGFKVTVDGADAAKIYYGAAKVDADGLLVTTLHAACDARDPSNSNGPTLGAHTIGVRAHVAGAPTDPPEITAQWNFSCTDETVGLDGGSGDGGDSGDGGVNATSASNGGSGCACSSAGGSPDRSTPLLLVVGILGVLAAKRRTVRRRATR